MFVANAMTDPLLRMVAIALALQLFVCVVWGVYRYIDELTEAITAVKFFVGGWLLIVITYLAFHWIATSESACGGASGSGTFCFLLALPIQGMVWMDEILFSVPVVGAFYGLA